MTLKIEIELENAAFECSSRNARLIASAPALLAALKGLLDQATGPAGIWGDGRGNDGKKTGLSGQEFNELREARIQNARAAIAKAQGGAK